MSKKVIFIILVGSIERRRERQKEYGYGRIRTHNLEIMSSVSYPLHQGSLLRVMVTNVVNKVERKAFHFLKVTYTLCYAFLRVHTWSTNLGDGTEGKEVKKLPRRPPQVYFSKSAFLWSEWQFFEDHCRAIEKVETKWHLFPDPLGSLLQGQYKKRRKIQSQNLNLSNF